jgi:hypothetical protein
VSLSLAAEDEGSGVIEMRFSNDGATWSPWEPYRATKAWHLAEADAAKRAHVYAQFRDRAGNPSSVQKAGIAFKPQLGEPSSATYRLVRSVVGIAGGAGEKQSESFQLQSTVGQASSIAPHVAESSEHFQILPGYWGGQPLAYHWADVNHDWEVDAADLQEVATHWRCTSGDGCYRARCDANDDARIDVIDIMLVAGQWGW